MEKYILTNIIISENKANDPPVRPRLYTFHFIDIHLKQDQLDLSLKTSTTIEPAVELSSQLTSHRTAPLSNIRASSALPKERRVNLGLLETPY